MSEVDTAVDGAEVATLSDETPVEPVVEQATDEQDSATADDDAPEDKQEPARNEKGQFQGRINEITRARREAERQLASERQLREQYEQQLAHYQRQPSQQHQGNEAPKLADFNYDMDAWSVALTQHAERRASENVESRLHGQEAQRQRQQMAQGFEVKAQQYATANPGYHDRVAELDSAVQFRPEVIEAIGLSDHGPAIADYLATHLDEADQLSRLPAHLAAVQIGRLESRVSTSKPKPVTNAPNPPPTLSGGSVAGSKDLGKLSYAAYKAQRMKDGA